MMWHLRGRPKLALPSVEALLASSAIGLLAGVLRLVLLGVRGRRRRQSELCLQREAPRYSEPLAEVVARCEASWLLDSLTAAMQGDAGARAQVGTMLLAGYGARQEGDEAGRWVRHAWAIQNYRCPEEVEGGARDGPQGQEERAGRGGDGGGCSSSGRGGNTGRGGGSGSGISQARAWCARTLRRAMPHAAASAAPAAALAVDAAAALVPPEPGGSGVGAVASAAATAVSLSRRCAGSMGSSDSEPSSETESDAAVDASPPALQRGGSGSGWAWAATSSSSSLLGLDVARARSGSTGWPDPHAAGRQASTRDRRQLRRASAGALSCRPSM